MTRRRIPWWTAVLVMIVGIHESGCASRSSSVAEEQLSGAGSAQTGQLETRPQPLEQVVETPLKDVPPAVAELVPDLPLPPAQPETPYLLDVLFDFDQYGLRLDAVTAVETNAHNLSKDDSAGQIILEGRADEVGTAAYNMVLGERRARSVQRYLESLGMSRGSISVVSYGKDRPLCLEHHPDCWQKNRSVRFKLK